MIAEDAVGPSGIAIALKSAKQVMVKGDQHFNVRWRDLVCTASPIVNPLTQQVVGAVNVTCLAVEQNKHLRIALRTVANGIQQVLLSSMRLRQRQLVDAHTETRNSTRAPVISFDGQALIIEKELEFLELSATTVRDAVERLDAHAREVRLPTGHLVKVVRHDLGPAEPGISLVFDRHAVERSRFFSPEHVGVGLGSGLSPLERAERDTIASTLVAVDGNKKTAAEVLGISRGTLYDRLHRYGLELCLD